MDGEDNDDTSNKDYNPEQSDNEGVEDKEDDDSSGDDND